MTTEHRHHAYRNAVGRRFGERILAGDAAFLSPPAFDGLPCTINASEVKPFSRMNALILMQVMQDHDWTDPRFFTLEQIQKAGWKMAPDAAKMTLQFMESTNKDRLLLAEPVIKRFDVYHASDIEGIEPWKRPDLGTVADLASVLAQPAIGIATTFPNALHDWLRAEIRQRAPVSIDPVGEALRVQLASTFLHAAIGIGADRTSSEVANFKLQQQWVHALIENPLSLYSAVADAERVATGLIRLMRTTAMEQATSIKVNKTQSVAEKTVSPRIAALFELRQAVLAVPFSEKDKAIAQGALWHAGKRIWFVPPAIDLAAFKEWNPHTVALSPVASDQMLLDDFRKAMESLGLKVPAKLEYEDGRWHNIPAYEGKKGNKAGAYLLMLHGGKDGVPCGYINNKFTGERLSWRYEGALLTPEQRARFSAEALAREVEAKKEELTRRNLAAVHANEIWERALPADVHGYLQKKGVSAEGVRQVLGAALLEYDEFKGESGLSIIRKNEKYVLVPLQTVSGEIRGLQAISADGAVKCFMRGAQKSGLMFVQGAKSFEALLDEANGIPAVGYAEGMATAASFRAVTGIPVVVCFDAGNMESVISSTVAKLPPKMAKIFAVDNDQFYVERLLATVSENMGLNPHAPTGQSLAVRARAGSAPDSFRVIRTGEIVVNGEWQNSAKGKYRITAEQEPGCDATRSLSLEMVPLTGRKLSSKFENRGAKVAFTTMELIQYHNLARNCQVVSPWFSSLNGRPTDWNDLAMREGLQAARDCVIAQIKLPDVILDVPLQSREPTLDTKARTQLNNIER